MEQKSKYSIVFDLGNSTVTSALFENGEIKETWRIPSFDLESVNDFKAAILSSLPFEKNEIKLDNVVASSVVFPKTRSLVTALDELFHTKVHLASLNAVSKLIEPSTISNELGVDIYANLVEARVKKPQDDVIIVDFGTALTYSIVNSMGYVKGVAIAPGVKTGLRGLLQYAPLLSQYASELSIPLSTFGDDTKSAIDAGVFYSVRGMVREMIHEMEKENGRKCYRIATGGQARIFAPFADIFDEIDTEHTIKGIYNIFNF